MASINGRAPAFLRLPSNGLPNYTGQCGEGVGSYVRACVRFLHRRRFLRFYRTNEGPLPTHPREIVPSRFDGIAAENRLNPYALRVNMDCYAFVENIGW